MFTPKRVGLDRAEALHLLLSPADLSSTQGAAAAADYTASLEPTVAKKWNATYGACGSAVGAAAACENKSST